MNRHSYRLVFNRARGALVAVGEGVRSVCKSASGGGARSLVAATLALAGASQAQIVADPNSPGNQRPTVLTAPNGTPLVNIQTPSAAGVSRNTYRQFDVNANGAILNNSRTDAPTQLGGWVQGNPWLAGGSARVILNEVNSTHPSQLKGWVEVAGQRAEVVIANPAGIQVNGAGFINASGVTLTTGAPVFNGSSLDAYRVQGGRVLITGNGLDTRDVDVTTILARAVELNAGLWAKHLKMVTGANTVDAATQAPTGAAAPTGPAPTFALDVAQIGGMYAGQIHLIGTEAGLGVNQRGVLSANADRLVLDINGQLSNRGQIYGDQVAIKSPQVNNVGPDAVIAARQRLDITTQALTNQSATIESLGSMSLVATQLSNTNPGLTTRTERFITPESGAYILINGVRYTEGQLGRCFMCASDRYDDGSNTPRLEFVTPSVQYPFEAGYARQPYQLEVTTGYDAGGEQGWTTLTTPYDYPPDHPAWALFGVPVGEQTQLRARLSAYNQDFMARAHRDFDRVWITSSQTEQTVVTNPGQAARIAAAGDLNIVGGAIHNDNSHILAGGTLDISGSTLSNTQTNGYRTVTDHGTFRRDNIEYSPYRLRAGYYGGGDYVAVRETFTTALGGASVQGNTSIVPSTSGLWRSSPDPTSRYLIEIDPNFANHRQWISSDYLLSALGVDPLSVHKRLGDSLYEQKLVREQVAQLTGQRFLGDHTDDDAQYRTLLDAGATFAQAHQLRPGIALNADQVAALTSDIVWLVAQEVLLPDGGRTTVLAPQVYVLPREGDLDGSGALLAGRRVNINLSGDLSNAGQIAGRQVVQLNAANVQHMGTVAGRTVHIEAEGDIQLQGGQVVAQRSLEVSAGRDLTLQGTTRSATATAGASSSQLTQLDRVAGLYVTGEVGVLVASAGRDIDLRTVTTAQASNLTANTRNYLRQSDTQEVGSQITSGGSITLTAERDLNARAGSVNATGDLMAAAGGAIRITEGRSTNQGDDARFVQKSGFMSSRTEVSREQSSSDTAVASEFGGRTVHLESLGGNTQIRGSRVIGDQGATVIAQGDIDIQAAQQTHSSSTYRQTTKNGLGAMGGISYGTTEQSTDQRTAQTTAAASTVGTVTGDVTLIAGHSYKQNGSDVLAPGGDINIQAQDIAITEARETRTSRTEETFKSSGVNVSLGGALMSAAQNTTQMASAIQKTNNTRMRALGVAAAGLNLYSNAGDIGKAADALASGDLQNAGSISISVGSSRSQSVTETQASGSRSSTVAAGGSVSLIASGAESSSHILVRGSDITAGNTARLMAEGDITLEAARNDSEEHSRESSQSASVGFSLGAQTGITVSASRGKGQGDGYETAYSNTHVNAGNRIEIDSSGDTMLKGATVRAGQIVAKVGGDLSVESLQDTATYNERSQSAGFSVTVGPSSSGSISTGKTKIDSDYRSVTEQSGLRAGAGGFQVVVNGHTDLKGGAITSSQTAIDHERNRFETGSLHASNLINRSSASADSSGIDLGLDMLTQGKYGMAKALVGNGLNQADASTHSMAETKSVVSVGQVVITDEVQQFEMTRASGEEVAVSLTRDANQAHQAVQKQDVQVLKNSVEADRIIKMAAYKQVTVHTDAAYKALFKVTVKFYKVTCGASPEECLADPRKVVMQEISQEEAKHNGKVLAVNGILNDADRAGQLAYQNASVDQEFQKPDEIHLMYIPRADTTLGEVLVAGYEKLLAPTLGYSNADKVYADTLQGRGQASTVSLGHSRGTIVQTNAFNIAAESGYQNDNLTVVGFGGAVTEEVYRNAADSVSQNPENVNFTYMRNDPVSVIAAGNPGDATAAIKEFWNVMFSNNSAHSCYGTGAAGCATIANPVPGGPVPTNQRPQNIMTYQGGNLVRTQGAQP